MIKAVIFDLDDTLISERAYIESGFRYISKFLSLKIGITESEVSELLIKLFNDSPKHVFNRLFDEVGIHYTNDDIIELVDIYRSHKPTIEFFQDVLPCLAELKNRGIKLGIITDGYAISQRQKLLALNADKYFDEIILTDELGREYWKPHPKAFEIMSEKMDVLFQHMIYVGDNPAKDFYIREVYPVQTVRIMRSSAIYRETPYYKGVSELFRIDSLNDLISILIKR
jgi:putative hydrolase of the HAD superfamily